MAIYKDFVKSFDSFISSNGISKESLNNDRDLYAAIRKYEQSVQRIMSKGQIRDLKDYYYNKAYAASSGMFKLESKASKKALNEETVQDMQVGQQVDVEDYGTGLVDLITQDSITVRFANNDVKTFLSTELYKVKPVEDDELENPELDLEPSDSQISDEESAGPADNQSVNGGEVMKAESKKVIVKRKVNEAKKGKAIVKMASILEALDTKVAKLEESNAKYRVALSKLVKIMEDEMPEVESEVKDAAPAVDAIETANAGEPEMQQVADAAPDTKDDSMPAPIAAEARRMAIRKKLRMMEEADDMAMEDLPAPAAEIVDVAIEQDNKDEVGSEGDAVEGELNKADSMPAPIALESKRKNVILKQISEMKILSGINRIRG